MFLSIRLVVHFVSIVMLIWKNHSEKIRRNKTWETIPKSNKPKGKKYLNRHNIFLTFFSVPLFSNTIKRDLRILVIKKGKNVSRILTQTEV